MKIRFKQDKRTILQILKSAGMKRKIRVLDKLNGVNERDSINILLKVLEDRSWVLREKAAQKLPRYGSKVIPRLMRLVTRGYWYTRAAACLALGETGSIQPIPAIIELLLHEDNPTVVKEAVQAFVKLARDHIDVVNDAFNALDIDEVDRARIIERVRGVDPDLAMAITVANEHE